MRRATASWEMNSHYTPVKCLGNWQLSEALIFEKMTLLKIVNFIYIYFIAEHEKCNSLLGDEQPLYPCKMSVQLSAERSFNIQKNDMMEDSEFPFSLPIFYI
jgi:hypothetical protein